MASKNKPNEIYIDRIYNAPVKLVWEAWTDPEQVAKWWGPRGFTITTHSKDLKKGGHWAYTMHGPDGVNYENKTIYHEVETYSKLVYDHGGNDDRPPLFQVTVTFKEISPQKTKMEMTMRLETAEAAVQIKKHIKQANGNSTWDRLGEYLEKKTSGQEKFVINRSFNAPIDLLFKVWTEPEHIQKWLSPTGTEMEFLDVNIQEGGGSFYSMFNKDMRLYGKTKYLEITRPYKLVYTQIFCDQQGKTSKHPLAPVWPETMLTTVEFNIENDTETRVTITWEVTGPATAEEIQFFANARTGMTMGWTGSFDKLEEYLVSINERSVAQ